MTRRKTHCKRGHEFTEENTRVSAAGRHCKTCDAERSARIYADRKKLGQYTRKLKVDAYIPIHKRSLEEKLADPEYGPLLRILMEERAAHEQRKDERGASMPKTRRRPRTRMGNVWVGDLSL
jgi:hypothetical protein